MPRAVRPGRHPFLDLRLEGPDGPIADNFYWLEPNDDFRGLARLPSADLSVTVAPVPVGGPIRVTVANRGSSPALLVRLRLVDAPTGVESLPTHWSDNYLNLLPGESVEVSAEPQSDGMPPRPAIDFSGFNVREASLPVVRR